MPDDDQRLLFDLFNEVGIIGQLSRALFEARLPEGVLVPHFSLLNHLVRVKDGQTPLALARAFQVPKTTLSHTLSLVEARGWVELRPNPSDGRSKLVWITEAGRKFREDAITALAPDLQSLAQQIDPTLVPEILPRLRELRVLLDANRDPAGLRNR